MNATISEILRFHLQFTNRFHSDIADAAHIPPDTFKNWLTDKTRYPQDWQGLIRLADQLGLGPSETQELLDVGSRKSRRLDDVYDTVETRHTLPALQRILNRAATDKRSVIGQQPFLVPPALPYFVTRPELQQRIERFLFRDGQKHICLVGMGGVGKSMLAIQLAHELRDRFVDGILWAQLDKSDITYVLNHFAHAYGEDLTNFGDVPTKAAALRGILADKQGLMILDNVDQFQEVELLLPSTSSWSVLVTMRPRDIRAMQRRFTIVEIDVFESHESLKLFQHHLRKADKDEVEVDGAIAELSALLSHHPLALDIAASRLAYDEGLTISQYVSELQQSGTLFEPLADIQWNIRASLQLSYDQLDIPLQQLFQSLCVFHGASFSTEAAGYVAKLGAGAAESGLQALYNFSLLQRADAKYHHYRLHPLLRELGNQILNDREPARRMVAYYQQYLESWPNNEERIAPESGNVRGALKKARELGLSKVYVQIANYFYPFLKTHGLYEEAHTYLEEAVVLARQVADVPLLIDSLRNLGELSGTWNDDDSWEPALIEAWSLTEELGDTKRLSFIAMPLGSLYGRAGNYEKAQHYLQIGERAARENKDEYILCELLLRLSSCSSMLQKLDEARAYIDEALVLARQQGNADLVSLLLINRGSIAERKGEHWQARDDWGEALELARKTGYQERICSLVINIGNNFTTAGRYVDAEPYLREGLTLATEMEHVWHLPSAWAYYGQWLLAQYRIDEAEQAFDTMLSIESLQQFPDMKAEALWGHARIARERKDLDKAEALARQCIAIMAETNPYYVPEMEEWLEQLKAEIQQR